MGSSVTSTCGRRASGAAQDDAYRQAIEAAGLRITTSRKNPYQFISEQARNASGTYGVKSISLLAVKPSR